MILLANSTVGLVNSDCTVANASGSNAIVWNDTGEKLRNYLRLILRFQVVAFGLNQENATE